MDSAIYGLLALPLFFGLGWLAARFDLKSLLSESRKLPDAYFKGLNFLLNEKPDEALEVLSEVARESHGASELQFALGGLFRRRGEIDRATRLHQGLLNREDLSQEERLKAMFELGQDYQKAGLYDRAEALFQKLEGTSYAIPALLFLKDIYCAEKAWDRALPVLDRLLQKRDVRRDAEEKAQILAECAEAAFREGRQAEAYALLESARKANPEGARPLLLTAEWALAQGDVEAALAAYQHLPSVAPESLFLAAPAFLKAFEAEGRAAQGVLALKGWVSLAPTLELICSVYLAILRLEGAEAAYAWISDVQQSYPDLGTLEQYAEARATQPGLPDAKRWQSVQALLKRHSETSLGFICQHCGFKARQFHWQCPACSTWESMPLAHRLSGDHP